MNQYRGPRSVKFARNIVFLVKERAAREFLNDCGGDSCGGVAYIVSLSPQFESKTF